MEGGGWAILVWSPRDHRLEILQAEKHQNLSQWDVVPLLALDVWEHAYYLKHQSKRKDYIKDWWNVVYWPAVAERFKHASELKWKPFNSKPCWVASHWLILGMLSIALLTSLWSLRRAYPYSKG